MQKKNLEPLFSYLDNFDLNDLYRKKMYTERIYFIIYNEIGEPDYFEFFQKCETNSILIVLKSLKLYEVIGRGNNKKIYMHPKIQLALCMNNDSHNSAIFIKDLVDGKFNNMPKIEITNWIDYMLLPNSKYNNNYTEYKTYLIQNPENNFIKIGRSKNITQRILSLNSEFKTNMVLIASFNNDIESKLHLKYSKYRIFGEWFDFDNDTLLDIINEHNKILITN
jgi:hypothetical protein